MKQNRRAKQALEMTAHTRLNAQNQQNPPATGSQQNSAPQPQSSPFSRQGGQQNPAQQAAQTPPQKPSNPFSSGGNRPAFGSRPQPPAQQNPPQNSGQTQGQQRPGGLLNRFGPARLNWEITPVTDTLIRFDLTGLGDPFHRLLGEPLNLTYGDPNNVIKALESRAPGVAEIEALLDQVWAQYVIRGAILVYPWSPDLKRAIVARPTVDIEQPEKKDDEDDEQKESAPIVERKGVSVFRSMDMLLVMNVLARARSQLLLANAPAALESRYLDRSLVTDDPRLVALAMATGCIEEHVAS